MHNGVFSSCFLWERRGRKGAEKLLCVHEGAISSMIGLPLSFFLLSFGTKKGSKKSTAKNGILVPI